MAHRTLSFVEDYVVGAVVDIEMMLGFPAILIDILMDESMNLSPYDRNISWINDNMRRLTNRLSFMSTIHIREFFKTKTEAEAYSNTVGYPR